MSNELVGVIVILSIIFIGFNNFILLFIITSFAYVTFFYIDEILTFFKNKNIDKKLIKPTFSDMMNIIDDVNNDLLNNKSVSNLIWFMPFIVIYVFHFVLVAIIYSIIYTTYIVFKLLDNIYLKNHITICPFCYNSYKLPNYKCSKCDEIHDNIKPSLKYGIFYHKCKCGGKLPVFQKNRDKLQIICPNKYCKNTLSHKYDISKEKRVIAILGGDEKSKNIILFKTIQYFKNNFNNIKFINKSDERVYNGYRNSNLYSYNFDFLTNILANKYLFYLYKPTNRDLKVDNMIDKDIYSYSDGIIFVINILSFKEMEQKFNRQYNGIKAEEIINKFLEVLLLKKDLSLKSKYNKSVTFVFYTNGLIDTDIDNNKLKELKEKYLLQLIETNFSNYYFVTIHKNNNFKLELFLEGVIKSRLNKINIKGGSLWMNF